MLKGVLAVVVGGGGEGGGGGCVEGVDIAVVSCERGDMGFDVGDVAVAASVEAMLM